MNMLISHPRCTIGRGIYLAVLASCFAMGLPATHAAQPSLKPLLPSQWPGLTGGFAVDVKVMGNYAYVAAGSGGLAIIDVSDPAHCVRVGGYATVGSASEVAVAGNYAYVASGNGGLQVVDVSDPAHCVRVGGYSAIGEITDVAVVGNYAYVTFESEGLEVIDVSNPTNCVRVGGYNPDGDLYGVAVSNNRAYLAGQFDERGLEVVDVSNPTNCVYLGAPGGFASVGEGFGVAVAGDYVYVAGEYRDGRNLVVFRLSGGLVPVVGGYDTGRHQSTDVAVWGNYAYVADQVVGVTVIDVSNPTNCVRVGVHDTSGLAWNVDVFAGRIYVADLEGGLVVMPTLPNVQFTVRVEADPGTPFTLEAATNLSAPNPWSPLVTTNISIMPFDYVDYDVKLSEKPKKFYRIRQP